MASAFFKPCILVDNYFGGCPSCGMTNGYFNVGRDHYFYCESDQTIWSIGSNLFSTWKEESEADWERNKRRFEDYELVEPLPFNDAEVDR